MTLKEMDDLLRQLLSEPESGADAHLPAVESLQYLIQGHLDVAERAKVLRKKTTLSFAAGQASAELPTDWVSTIRVYAGEPLRETSQEKLDVELVGCDWQAQTGEPEAFYHFGRELFVFPKPYRPVSVELWYAALPDTSGWSTDTWAETPSPLPIEFQFCAVLYAKWLAVLKREQGRETSESLAAKQMYETVLAQRRATFDRSQHEYTRVAAPRWGW